MSELVRKSAAQESDIIAYNAIHVPPCHPTSDAGGMVKFVCNAEDRIGQADSFAFGLERHPDEVRAGLADLSRQHALFGSATFMSKSMVLEAKP